MSTPRAAAVAGVLFAILFGAVVVLVRTALPEGAEPGSQWLVAGNTNVKIAVVIMPFAGIAFLWFIGVVRDGFGGFEDKFFSTAFIGSGLLFLAMMFAASAVGSGLVAASADVVDPAAHAVAVTFGEELLVALGNTYGLRMAAVFMMSLATIWLKTGLMPRWLVIVTYLAALGILVATGITAWLTLAFPVWVLVVSLLLLRRQVAEPETDTV